MKEVCGEDHAEGYFVGAHVSRSGTLVFGHVGEHGIAERDFRKRKPRKESRGRPGRPESK